MHYRRWLGLLAVVGRRLEELVAPNRVSCTYQIVAQPPRSTAVILFKKTSPLPPESLSVTLSDPPSMLEDVSRKTDEDLG